LAQFAEPGDIKQLAGLQPQINEYLKHLPGQQGMEKTRAGYQMTPSAPRLFQPQPPSPPFEHLQASRSRRHQGPVLGEGAVELQQTKPYEFGDSVAHLDIPSSFVNALLRAGPGLPLRMQPDDLVIQRTRNNPKCATVVLLDMSGSMRYDGQHV